MSRIRPIASQKPKPAGWQTDAHHTRKMRMTQAISCTSPADNSAAQALNWHSIVKWLQRCIYCAISMASIEIFPIFGRCILMRKLRDRLAGNRID